jgi:hypothetical protein
MVFVSQLSAQDCSRVWLKGSVADTLYPARFLNLMVVNRSTGKGVFGQADGSFGVYVNANDSIIISVKGYDKIGFRVIPDSSCQQLITVFLDPRSTQIQEVVVPCQT